ncbi:MAG: LacI family DNA-binding transcriptional regulator [Eubacteriales bacterium]
MSTTIKDIAKAADVSIATVSKVMNNHPSISETTRDKVLQIMNELEYHPNARASNFAKKHSNNIVFLSITEDNTAFSNPHMFEILNGAQMKLHTKQYTLSFIGTQTKEQAYNETTRLINYQIADGIIIHGSATSKKLVSLLIQKNFPHIIIGRPSFSTAACWIDTNNHVSGELATKYLLKCGYTKIAFMGGPFGDEISRHRLKGYRSTMELNHCPIHESFIKYGAYTKQSGYLLMEELLHECNMPEAVICENNQMAMGAANALEKKGLKVPDDIAIITFNDYPLSQLIDPPLTVVDINVNQMGQTAAYLLLEKIKNKDFHVQSFSTLPTLIERSSTKFVKK